MRIVTRPDFDGIVCAVLLSDVLDIDTPVKWAEPNAMQNRLVEIETGDIIANLAYHENCSMWFDHHSTNKPEAPFKGAYNKTAPSAAGIIFNYYKGKFKRNYRKLVKEADKIDSARLSIDEVLHPENYPYIAIDTTITSHNMADEPYWNRLVELLRHNDVHTILQEKEVSKRIAVVAKKNKQYAGILKEYTFKEGNVAVTDFRSLAKAPSGNRFLVFCLFPEANVHVKIRYHNKEKDKVIVSVGHSILNRSCKVDSGKLCSQFNGGGHKGAGSCSFPAAEAGENIQVIIKALLEKNP